MTTKKTAKVEKRRLANFEELMLEIRSVVAQGKGMFGIGHSSLPEPHPPFALILGSVRATTTHRQVRDSRGGYIVSLGLTLDQIAKLGDDCAKLVKEHGGPKAEKQAKEPVDEEEPA